MGEERLAALTLMTVHKNIEVCPEQVIRKYISQNSRRMYKKIISILHACFSCFIFY